MRFFAQAATALLLFAAANAEIFKGTITNSGSRHSEFAFIGKFAFDYCEEPQCNSLNPTGFVYVDLRVPAADVPRINGKLYLLMFDDEDAAGWSKVYPLDKHNLNCSQRHELSYNKEAFRFNEQGLASIPYPIHEGIRSRYWFASLQNCNSSLNNVEFQAHFVNLRTPRGTVPTFEQEFGVNVRWLNVVYASMFSLYVLLWAYHIYNTRRTIAELSYLHPLLKMFIGVLALQTVSVFFIMIHWAVFADNGMGSPTIAAFGEIADIVSRLFFIMMLLLLSRGWTISAERLQNTSRYFNIGIVVSFIVVQVAISIYRDVVEDPAVVEPSTVLQFLLFVELGSWAVFAVWFAIGCFNSWRNEAVSDKKTLYAWLGLFYTLWCLSLPAIVIMTETISPWAREKFIDSFTLATVFLANVLMSYLLAPARAVKYFTLELHRTHSIQSLDERINEYARFSDHI